MDGFKKFILRGNVVDLAVGIAVGAAFTTVINALVKDLITPLIGAIIKTPDFSNIKFVINDSTLAVGDVLNAVLSFLIVATAIYFLIVLPMNKLVETMKKREKPADPTNKKCSECLSDIPIQATRCAFCSIVQAV